MRGKDAVVAHGGLALEPEQPRHRRAIEIGIEEAGAQALGGKAEREIDGDRRLADAALARADGDDVAYAGDGLARRGTGAALGLGLSGRGLAAIGGQRDHDLAAFGDLFGGGLGALAGGTEGGLHARGDGDGESHRAGGDDDLAQPAIARERTTAGDFHGVQRGAHCRGDGFIGH